MCSAPHLLLFDFFEIRRYLELSPDVHFIFFFCKLVESQLNDYLEEILPGKLGFLFAEFYIKHGIVFCCQKNLIATMNLNKSVSTLLFPAVGYEIEITYSVLQNLTLLDVRRPNLDGVSTRFSKFKSLPGQS